MSNTHPQQTERRRSRIGRVAAVVGSVILLSALSAVAPDRTASAGSAGPGAVAGVSPAPGQTVGVAHPVTVTFTEQVTDRRAAELAIAVRPAGMPAVPGTFTWLDNDVVEFTPTEFLPAHTPVSVSVNGFSTSFETGASVVSVADIDAHTFTVSIDGEVAREMPASMGKSGFATPTGSFTALSKERYITFDSRTIGIPLDDPEGYLIDGEYGVRVTWGGVYVHSAPWSVGSQGYANVSHGCINLSPDNAAWYFDTVQVGDPIIVQA